MAILKRVLPKKNETNYSKYKESLEILFKHSCGYCLLPQINTQIDHYVPIAFDDKLEHEYSNLVLSCGLCNSKSCKSDYHPNHKNRNTRKKDKHGYLIHEITKENSTKLFTLNANGDLIPKNERGIWLISVFSLNSPKYVSLRYELNQCIILQSSLKKSGTKTTRALKLYESIKRRHELLIYILELL